MFQGCNYEHRPAVIKPPCFQMTCPKWRRLESNDIRTLISALQDTTQHQTTSIRHDQISYTKTQKNSTSIDIPQTGFHKKKYSTWTIKLYQNLWDKFLQSSLCSHHRSHTKTLRKKLSYPKIFHAFPTSLSLLPAKIQKNRRGHTQNPQAKAIPTYITQWGWEPHEDYGVLYR